MRASVLRSLLDAQRRRQPVALITNLASGEQRLIGAEESADDVLAAALAEGFRFDQSCVVDSEEGEFFVNIHNPPLKLVIIGAVHIAQALIPMAQVAGYNVVVIDPRGAFATTERFPEVELREAWPDEALKEVALDGRTALLALTHDPKIDDPALVVGLRSSCFYLGALGSKKTHAKRIQRLQASGFSAEEQKRIHAPVGLAIGARGAPEIAIAIMAEITQVLRTGSGRS
jgi:xanthine dehydrogenase accessory factor